MNDVTVGAIICAAGKGTRTGFAKNKLLVPFQGTTALEKTLSAFDFPAIAQIVVTANTEDFDEISALCQRFDGAEAVPCRQSKRTSCSFTTAHAPSSAAKRLKAVSRA